jgi:hypothetical protein
MTSRLDWKLRNGASGDDRCQLPPLLQRYCNLKVKRVEPSEARADVNI